MPDVDSAHDTVGQFAADLRALRLAADSPTLARLERETGVSKTVLSSAFGGRALPTARTVDRIARACGADAAPWVRRRDELAGLHPGEELPDSGSGPRRPPRVVAAVIAAFALGLLVSAGLSAGIAIAVLDDVRAEARDAARKELTDSPVNPRAQINVHNGVDPALTPCVNDAEVATSSPRTNNTLLEIIWSNKCYAGWARVTRYDEQISGNSVMVAIYPETSPQGPDRQSATEPNVQGAYTTLIVRPSPATRLCAVGVITLDGASIDLGEPLCI